MGGGGGGGGGGCMTFYQLNCSGPKFQQDITQCAVGKGEALCEGTSSDVIRDKVVLL